MISQLRLKSYPQREFDILIHLSYNLLVNSQTGFSPILIILMVVLVLGAFYLGARTTGKSAIETLGQAFQMNKDVLPMEGAKALPSASITQLSKTTAAPSSSTNSISDANNVTISGQNSYPGGPINWSISFPKKGGDIAGFTSGPCVTKITGHFDGPGSNNQGNLVGEVDGNCGPRATNNFNPKVKVTFSGIANMTTGKIEIWYVMTQPFSTQSGFGLSFNP